MLEFLKTQKHCIKSGAFSTFQIRTKIFSAKHNFIGHLHVGALLQIQADILLSSYGPF